MDKVRLGVVGTGGMGQGHLGYFKNLKEAELTAICDIDPDVLKRVSEKYPEAKAYTDYRDLLADGVCDGIIIATPHYFHPPIAIEGFRRGVHVLSEKPMAVYTKAAREAIDFHRTHAPNLVFTVMFMTRTHGLWRKAKEIMSSGQLGELRRISCLNTNWFRSQAYYNSGGWRATWGGEGGGVLLNQCPHNLDLITWLVGLPSRVTATVGIGKYHKIEVEDEVSAIFEFANGATGQFVTTTGEAPGSNHFEIAGDMGKMVITDGKIELILNTSSTQEFSDTTKDMWAGPPSNRVEVEIPPTLSFGHQDITQNFINAILHGEELIVKPEDGILGLMLGNALLMSGLKKRPVDIPFDDDEYKAMIEDLAAKSTYKKVVQAADGANIEDSFH